MLPFLHIFNIEIPSYFLWISILNCLALFWIRQRAHEFGMNAKIALDLSLTVMITGLIGGRLMHVFYEAPEIYKEMPYAVFYIWVGGFVFFGGAIAAGLGAFSFLKWKHLPIEAWFNLFAPVLCFMYGFGRIGCFLAGCCYGKFCRLPWAVDGRHPTQLYSFFWELGILILLLSQERSSNFRLKKSNHFLNWMTLSCLGRLLIENWRDDFRGPVHILSISAWISLIFALIGGSILVVRAVQEYKEASKGFGNKGK